MAAKTQNSEVNDRRERFILEYLANNHHGEKAAIVVGCRPGAVARSYAARVLADHRVQKRITELNSVTAHHLGITRAKLMERLNNQSGCNPKKMFNQDGSLKRIVDLDDETAAGIAGFEVTSILEGMGKVTKVKFRDSRAATDSLNKMLGWNMPEKVDVTTDDESLNDVGVEKLNANEKLMYLKLKQKMNLDDSGETGA